MAKHYSPLGRKAGHFVKEICFVLTTPFAVNAFLLGHLRALAEYYHVSLCVNCSLYPISPLMDSRVRIINIGIQRKISPLADLHTLWELICLFRRMRFDAVHSLTPKAGLLAMLAALFARVPRRYHTFTGQVWANKTGLERFIFKWIDWLIVTITTRVFADSKSQCRFLETEGVAGSGVASVLGFGSICGVDLERFCPKALVRAEIRADLAVTDNTCVFLYVGRLARDKGVFDLINVFTRLAEQHENLALWVVGPDDEGLLPELKKLCHSCNQRVRWIGATFEPERYMISADILVLPSYREGFGMVILEGAACGIPSIAYRIDGVIDAVKDAETGVLVSKGDIGCLAKAMCSLAVDELYRDKLGRNAIEYARNNFSGKVVTSAWVEFYRQELLNMCLRDSTDN